MDKTFLMSRTKRLAILFLVGLFLGCVYFNLLWRFRGSLFQEEWGMLLDRFYDEPLNVMCKKVFIYLIGMLSVQIVFFCFGIVKWGKIIFQGFGICFGIVTGALETLVLLCYDIQDSVKVLLKCICVLGMPLMILSFSVILANAFSSLKWYMNEKSKKWKKIQLKKYIFYFSWSVIVFIGYIMVFRYVNFCGCELGFFLEKTIFSI